MARLVGVLAVALWLVGCDDAGSGAGRGDGDAAADGAVPPPMPDAVVRPSDASFRDGIAPVPDAAEKIPDAFASGPDAAEEIPDAFASGPDAAEMVPDAFASGPDAAEMVPDAFASGPDAAEMAPDAAEMVPDAESSGPDAEFTRPDAGSSGRDGALDPPDAAPEPEDAAPVDAAVPPPPDACATRAAAPWTRRSAVAGGTVVFNELRFDDGAGFVELHNQNAIDVDLSGWTLEGAVRWAFPEGTILAGGGLLVVAADPGRLAGALGPADFAGGDGLDLRSQGGRLMDTVTVAAPPWPVPAAGHSLAKRDPDTQSDRAEGWTTGAPTPGLPNAPAVGAPPSVDTLVPEDAPWRHDGEPGLGWVAPDFDDGGWEAGPATFFAGEAARASGAVRATADNHFALYVGDARGDALRLAARDGTGDWTSPEDFEVTFGPGDHLYVAAWEPRGDDVGPRMVIAQLTLPDGAVVGTDAVTWQAILGPAGANPGGELLDPPPAADDVRALVRAATLADAWAAPAVGTDRLQAPWGAVVGALFGPAANYLWLDTFDAVSATNVQDTYALYRTRAPVLPPGGDTAVPAGPRAFRTTFDFDGDPAATRLALDTLVDDGLAVYLNGVEVYRRNLPPGPVDPATLALAPVERPVFERGVEIPADALVRGRNVLAVAVLQAAPDDPDLRFAAALYATARAPGPPAPVDGDVVINELMYHPTADGPEEWLELYNRGAEAVDLGGWQLVDAVGFRFPEGTVLEPDGHLVVARDAEAFRAAFPGVPVVGDYDAALGDGGDRVLLLDRCGAPADDVRYFDGGRWPASADGDGPSLELRDPWADNAAAEAWAASDEARHAAWEAVRYRGTARASAVGPDGRWEELVVGLLEAGEVLIDDLSVVEDPDGARIELLRNGTFGDGAAAWRFLGNHRHAEVVDDPDAPGNPVLRLVATGTTEHMHNHAETTLAEGRRVTNGAVYEISYRARWVAGSNQLNTRLYFNRLPRTTRLARPASRGTPGAPNSALVDNIGPTYAGFGHAPIVPAPGEAVTFSVVAVDPHGVADVTLWTSVEGAAFAPTAMAATDGGRFEATLPGWPAGARVQFYVEGVDDLGAASTFPAAGPASRALLQVEDGRAAAAGRLRPVRLLMTPADVTWFHTDVNLMSNEWLGGTVVYDDREVFYDVGLRAKGSQRGRPNAARLAFSVRFDPDRPFRGVFGTLALDRSGATGVGQREILIDQVMQRAGSVSAEYNDLAYVVSPLPAHTTPAIVQLTRTGDLLLGNQFPDGGDGMLFEYELVYYPTTTDDGTPQGRKRPQPDLVVGTNLRDLGDDPESYRHTFLIKNNRGLDDYDGFMRFAKVFGLPDAEFRAQAADVIDTEQFLRACAMGTLSGAVDHYMSGAQHNARFYVRPWDHRVLYFPHDIDFYPADPRSALVANNDLRRLLTIPGNTRIYYWHLHDIVTRAQNAEYLAHWRDHFGALLPGQDFAAFTTFLVERGRHALTGAADSVAQRFPPVDFALTTNGGADVETAAATIAVEGTAWIDVFEIRYAGERRALDLAWVDERTWRIHVPLAPGLNIVELEAVDRAGRVVGADTIVVTRTP